MTRKIQGWATDIEGKRHRLSEGEAQEIWDSCERAKEKRGVDMPDFDKAISTLHSAKTRLDELGWKDAIYCPKDGRTFAVIEYGSTGIFAASYHGEWPDGYLIYQDCVSHPKGCMWKPIADLTEQEAEILKRCDENHQKFMKREIRMLGAFMEPPTP